jgi:hypothetical protein
MGILDIFKSKKRREFEYFQNHLNITTEILDIIKRKKIYSDKDILDYDFDVNMREKITVLNYIKYGELDFLDEEIRKSIVSVFMSDGLDENYKRDISSSYNYLSGFTYKMGQIVEEKRENLNK